MAAYYNENDPYAAAWIRNLITAGLIAPGDVDDRDIRDVTPNDLRGFTQCHFFAGIGGWSYALRLAGWPDDRPVWTGSCPCQPFSAAGKGDGTADARHLWPDWFRLIRGHRPFTIFGEQVSAAIRHGWLDLVSGDLESLNYTVGAAVMGAHSVGAPHIRQRLWFVADRNGSRCGTGRAGEAGDGRDAPRIEFTGLRAAGELADADGRDAGAEGVQRGGQHGQQSQDGAAGELADASGDRQQTCEFWQNGVASISGQERNPSERPRSTPWSDADWLPCRDGKARPVEPGTFPPAHGVSNRVGRLRAYGNAIVPQAAAEFIAAFLHHELMS